MKNKIVNRILIAVAIFICWLQVPIGLHIKEELPAVAPTCINSGLTEGKRCVLCRKILRAQEVIPATGVHAYDSDYDTACNTCPITREVDYSIQFINYRVCVVDKSKEHKNIRATVFRLGDQTVEDPTDVDALEAIDENAETYWGINVINQILLTDAGNYVVLLRYNADKGAAAVKVPLVLNISSDPKLILDDNNSLRVVENNETNTNHSVTVFYMGANFVEDPYDAAAVKNAAVSERTYWGTAAVNSTEIAAGGNYVFHLNYDTADGTKHTVALQTVLTERPKLHMNEENMLIVEYGKATITNPRVYIYYLGNQTVDDIYDEEALEEIIIPTQIWGENMIAKTRLTEPGNYVIHLRYNVESGERKTVAIETTIQSDQ